MEKLFFEYLVRIDGYEENKIHRIQSKAVQLISQDLQTYETLNQDVKNAQIASDTHVNYVLGNMKCIDEGADGFVGLNNEVNNSSSIYKAPKVCAGCGFGVMGDIRSGCSVLLNKFWRQRRDIRITRLEPSMGIATHYGLEQAKSVQDFAIGHAPIIELAMIEFVSRTKHAVDSGLWSKTLSNYLWPLVNKDIGKHFKFGKNLSNYGNFDKLRTMLNEEFHEIDDKIRDSLWLPLIREFGIFTAIDKFTDDLSVLFNSSEGFSGSAEIVEYMKKYFKPRHHKNGEVIIGDSFRHKHNLTENDQNITAEVVCPGRSLALSICTCMLFNLDLRAKSEFAPAEGKYISLVNYDKQDNPHLQYPNQMVAKYEQILQKSPADLRL
jgi:hypothetical protein